MTVPLSDGWAEVLDRMDEKHTAAHIRLRGDLSSMENTVESNFRHSEDQFALMRARLNEIATLAAQPVDATKLVMSTKAIVSVVGAAIVIAASIWSLSTKIDAQQKAAEAAAQLATLQMNAMRESIATTQRQYELLRYEVQTLKETVIGNNGNKGRQR
jgi:hypothetical protein